MNHVPKQASWRRNQISGMEGTHRCTEGHFCWLRSARGFWNGATRCAAQEKRGRDHTQVGLGVIESDSRLGAPKDGIGGSALGEVTTARPHT